MLNNEKIRLMTRMASFDEVEGKKDIAVNAACCAGVTPDKHLAALETLRSCQIDVTA